LDITNQAKWSSCSGCRRQRRSQNRH